MRVALAYAAIGWMCWGAGSFCNAQTQPTNPSGLSPDLQEVVTLSRQQMGDDVITNYIKSTGKSYKLSADDIIYLKNQGVSQGVISALLQTASSSGTPADQNPLAAKSSMPAPAQTPSTPAATTPTPPGPTPSIGPGEAVPAVVSSTAPRENLVQEYDDYTFEVKECRLEDREDKQLNDGKPHKQLVCKVLITNNDGDRTLNMHGNVDGARIRAIDDTGTEYDTAGGTLGTSRLTCYAFEWPDAANAALVMPSGVPIKAELIFGVTRDGIGYFSPDATSLGILDIGLISQDTAGHKPFHIQFKNVPIPLVEAPPMTAPPIAPTTVTAPQPALAPVSAQETAPAPEINFAYFQEQLAPFGTWVEVPGYGQCWSPTQAIAADPNWRPYYDMGQWAYTENGWFWQSDYTWGDIPFHYGNWIIAPGYGWVWVPGYTWGPAWVFWRQAEADGCVGWAPLPPGAVFVNGGWLYHGVHYGIDFDFGLGEAYFAFIGYNHFHDDFFRMRGREYAFHVPRERIHAFYGRSVLRNEFRQDEHGRLINDGIGRDRIEQLTHHREEVTHFEERNPVGNREKLAAQRVEETRKQVGTQNVKSSEPSHEQFGKPVEHPAPVNKIFRPPTSLQNTSRTAPQRPTEVQKQTQKKQ